MKKITERIFTVCLLIALVSCLFACGGTKVYSEITSKCSLSVEYEGLNFITDGIGHATLRKTTDGDTAAFELSNGSYVVIRFYGIDTPESTGGVEKWGKSASNFTAEILNNASDFVLEATTTPASHDSYGVRYLGYVWYRNSEKDSWKNLNIQIVENGYSQNKCLQTSAYKYYSYFEEAEKFAEENKLHIWSDEEDPYYNENALEITIKEFWENTEQYYNEENQSGSKVRIVATLSDIYVSNSDSPTYTFRASQLINGEEYSILVYAGYESKALASFLKVGNEYSITGSIQFYDNNFQISGLTYVPLVTGGDYLTLTTKNDYYIFDSSTEYKSYYEDNALNTNLVITNTSLNDNILEITGTATPYNKKSDGEKTTYTISVPVSDDFVLENIIGKSLNGKGYKNEDNQIFVVKYSDLKIN